MTKNFLLTATALAAIAFAGAANASDLEFRPMADPGVPGDIDAGDTGGPEESYKLAEEANSNPGDFNSFALVTRLSPGATFPSGNNTIQIDLVGGVFGSNVGVAQVTAAGCTTVLSQGGSTGESRAIFLISSSGGGNCNAVNLDLPIRPNAGSDVTAITTLRTEAGTPIDPPNEDRLLVVERVNAFRVAIDGDINSTAPGGGALDDTFATLTVNPVYTTFFVGGAGHTGAPETSTVGQLGTIGILVDTTAFRDLFKNPVVAGDVTDADTTVTGSFVAFNGAGGGVTLGGVPATINAAATEATINNQEALLTSGRQPFLVDREATATPIPSSTYRARVRYTLDSAFYTQEGAVDGALETIGRDGTNVIFQWMNSTRIQTNTGTTNIIRLGNTNTLPTGPVFVQLLNTVNAGAGFTLNPNSVQLFPNISANGERTISTAQLTALLGDFGRGDILVSVEAPANTITARRYATLANGSTTELMPGSVAADQNNVNVP